MTQPVVKYPGIVVSVGGNDYVVPPVSLGFLRRNPDQAAKVERGDSDISQAFVVEMVCHCIKRNYPDLEDDAIADELDLGILPEFMLACFDGGRERRKKLMALATPETLVQGNPRMPEDLESIGVDSMLSSPSEPVTDTAT